MHAKNYCYFIVQHTCRRPLDEENNWHRMDCEITTNASYTGQGSELGQVLVSAVPDINNTLLGTRTIHVSVQELLMHSY